VRLDADPLHHGLSDARFADAGLARDQHDGAVACLRLFCSISADQLVEIGGDNFMNSPSGATLMKQVSETTPLISVPSAFTRIATVLNSAVVEFSSLMR
jgi:hypothetical protein